MRELLIAFLILNSLFWGLMPHSVHCELVAKFTSSPCPSHMVHLIIAIVSFILAVAVAQTDYLSELYDMFMVSVQTGGRLVNSAVKFFKKNSKNANTMEAFANQIETYVDNI